MADGGAHLGPIAMADREAIAAAQGYGGVTTEILAAPEFYFAEDYHQQYLAKNPSGYCGLGGTGVKCGWQKSDVGLTV